MILYNKIVKIGDYVYIFKARRLRFDRRNIDLDCQQQERHCKVGSSPLQEMAKTATKGGENHKRSRESSLTGQRDVHFGVELTMEQRRDSFSRERERMLLVKTKELKKNPLIIKEFCFLNK